MKFEFDFTVEPQSLYIKAHSEKPATLCDWILVLEDLQVEMKANFARQVSDRWDLKKSLSDQEKTAVLGELDKLEAPHPNLAHHNEVLNQAVMDLVHKLELKQNMEHLN